MNDKHITLFVVFLTFILCMLFVLKFWESNSECVAKGGTLVRGTVWYVCVDKK
jgi:hypothetical protein